MNIARKRTTWWVLSSLCFILSLICSACGSATSSASLSSTAASSVKVVAAENFYGDIVKQLGGEHVSVTSILSDPNVDPHQYEANNSTARAVSDAQLILKNGLGYDDWMDTLLSSAPNTDRTVITAGDVATHKLEDNPHIWYGVENAADVATAITDALKKLDPADTLTFEHNLATFKASLQPLQQQLRDLKTKYAGTPVALTETIFLYQTTPIGLNVLTPLDFQKANAEGNDPTAAVAARAQDQIDQQQVKLLIYNVQTPTKITLNMQKKAEELRIPVVPVSETMPVGKTYQRWMSHQLQDLGQALATSTGK